MYMKDLQFIQNILLIQNIHYLSWHFYWAWSMGGLSIAICGAA
jgi:hypothetical protein